MPIPTPPLQTEADGTLVNCKDRPSGHDLAMISLIVNGAILFGGVFCFLPFSSAYQPAWAGTLVAIGLGITILAVGLTAAIRYYRRINLGQWWINSVGVEFASAQGDDHRLAWREIDRVWWGTEAWRIVGPHSSLFLRRDLLPEADWQAVRDRVEAELSPRFDLPPCPRLPESSLLRPATILLPTVPLGLLFLGYSLVAPALSPFEAGLGRGGMALLAVGVISWVVVQSHRDAGPRPTAWRSPRPALIGGNGRDSKKW